MSPSKLDAVDFTTFYNIINGEKRESKESHRGINPATQEELWPVPVGTLQDVDEAVTAAEAAFKSWSETAIDQRKEYIRKFVDAYSAYEKEFVDLLCKETGKPRQFATGEVKGTAFFMGDLLNNEMPEDVFEDDEKIITTRFTPLGVVAGICPWNFPLLLSAGKVVPALITGNVIILKPSPYTPYATLKMVEIAQQVLPPGVVQVLGGSDKLGPMLTAHPGIAKISFTGSIPTGKKIYEACAKTMKRVTLELGGNDATIVMPDVDIAKAAPEVVQGAFTNSGQVCVAIKRIYIHESIYTKFLEAMVEVTKKLKVGASDEEGVTHGPIQNAMQYEKVKDFFADSKASGYKFAVGSPDVPKSAGYFIQPTIIDNPPNESRIVQEEPFGPIVPCQPWSDEEEVIARANNTNTGLGACVFGKDVAHAERIGRRLQAGSVFINSYEKPAAQAFFSGHKESGLGGEWGKAGLTSYCNAHVMHVYKNKE